MSTKPPPIQITRRLQPGRTYLYDMLRTLWPEPHVVEPLKRWSRHQAGTPEFVIVPHERRPMLVLPRAPRRATAAALRNYKTSASARTAFKLRTLALGLRFGLGQTLPDQLRISLPRTTANGAEPGREGIDAYLGAALGFPVVVALYIGPARAVQKPVLQLLNLDGETVGFAKIGVTDFTRALVRSEGEALALLGSADLRRIEVPRVLHRGQWGAQEVLVQAAMAPGGASLPPEALGAGMAELARVSGTTSGALAESGYLAGLSGRVAALAPDEHTALLSRTLDNLHSTAGRTVVELGSWHGDWAPWNMTVADGRALVWDWEQFESGVPLGFDAIHFHIQRLVVSGALPPAEAFADAQKHAATLLAPFGVAPADAPLLVLLYACELATRYLRDGEVELGGTKLSRLSTWLPAVLDQHRPSPTPPPAG